MLKALPEVCLGQVPGTTAAAAGPADLPAIWADFNDAGMVSGHAYAKGLRIRKEVLGEAYVDRAMAAADDFNRDFQRLVTSFCWGESWGREDGPLSRRDRSLMNLVMLGCLNRGEEFKLHVKGAMNNGLSKDEIAEIFLQSAIYCGVPAAIDSFRTAKDVFKEMGL